MFSPTITKLKHKRKQKRFIDMGVNLWQLNCL
jgi:hypothetical protein